MYIIIKQDFQIRVFSKNGSVRVTLDRNNYGYGKRFAITKTGYILLLQGEKWIILETFTISNSNSSNIIECLASKIIHIITLYSITSLINNNGVPTPSPTNHPNKSMSLPNTSIKLGNKLYLEDVEKQLLQALVYDLLVSNVINWIPKADYYILDDRKLIVVNNSKENSKENGTNNRKENSKEKNNSNSKEKNNSNEDDNKSLSLLNNDENIRDVISRQFTKPLILKLVDSFISLDMNLIHDGITN